MLGVTAGECGDPDQPRTPRAQRVGPGGEGVTGAGVALLRRAPPGSHCTLCSARGGAPAAAGLARPWTPGWRQGPQRLSCPGATVGPPGDMQPTSWGRDELGVELYTQAQPGNLLRSEWPHRAEVWPARCPVPGQIQPCPSMASSQPGLRAPLQVEVGVTGEPQLPRIWGRPHSPAHGPEPFSPPL